MTFHDKLNDLVSSEIAHATEVQDWQRASECIEALLWSVAMCIAMTTGDDDDRREKFAKEAGACIADSVEEWVGLVDRLGKAAH